MTPPVGGCVWLWMLPIQAGLHVAASDWTQRNIFRLPQYRNALPGAAGLHVRQASACRGAHLWAARRQTGTAGLQWLRRVNMLRSWSCCATAQSWHPSSLASRPCTLWRVWLHWFQLKMGGARRPCCHPCPLAAAGSTSSFGIDVLRVCVPGALEESASYLMSHDA